MQSEGSPIRIVLVDDETSVLFALKLLLQAIGFHVTDFSDSTAALKFLSDGGECDIVICDLRMPLMSGIKVLEQSKLVRPCLPFLLMSGHATDEEAENARLKGAAGFLAKPFRPEEVKELIAQSLAPVLADRR